MMRSYLLGLSMLLVSGTLLSQGASINWIKVDELEAAQAKEPRKVLIDVYTKWCGPCKMMMRNTFTNGDVISYINENYYAVKFDAEGPDPVEFKGRTFSNPTYVPNKAGRNGVHELSRAFQVSAYPTIVYLDENLEMIAPISGYKSPQQLELYLRFFDDAWAAGTTQDEWNTYQESFKPTFQ
ncbi:MAG: thioredoxin family protein [Flavobacteriales bacterium]|nr:thioredoxin family protein [Flavobacteriales bacterium]